MVCNVWYVMYGDFHISFNNSCTNNSTLNEYECEYNNYILTRLGCMCIWDILTWDPHFRYDFHISFNISCSNNSTLNEYESEYNS